MGRGFKSFCPCQNNERVVAIAMALLLFCAWVGGLEGETVQSELPVDVRDRGKALPAGKEVLLPLQKNELLSIR